MRVQAAVCNLAKSSASRFFHPDYTVGPGVSPDPALKERSWAVPPIGNFTLAETAERNHPAPKNIQFVSPSWSFASANSHHCCSFFAAMYLRPKNI
jgi:hypothetical protein